MIFILDLENIFVSFGILNKEDAQHFLEVSVILLIQQIHYSG